MLGADGLESSAKAATTRNSLDATLPESWIEIHPDNTILIRTGKSDFGQSTTFTAYRQIVAEELSAPFEAITTVVMGDTDRTPDGSGAFDFLGSGMPNIRKAAAYTYQALLDLASQSLGVPKSEVSVKDGVVSGGGKSMTYGDLVKGQKQVKLTIPVKGDLDQHHGPDRGRKSAHEAGEPIHGRRQVLSEFRYRFQSRRQGDLGDGCAPPRNAARKNGASQESRLDAGIRGRGGQNQISKRAGDCEGQPCGSGRAHGVGSHPRRAAGGRRHEVEGLERAAWKRAPVRLPEARRRLENHPRHEKRQIQGRGGAGHGGGRKEAFRHLSASLYEARTHGTYHGCRWSRSPGRNGLRLHA